MIPTDPTDRDVLAGEYVLGFLDEAAAAEVEAALDADGDLARRVLFWEERLMPAGSAAARPVSPDPRLWARIERDLALPDATRAAGRVLSARIASRHRRAFRLWNSAPLWRGVAALATAAAILLAVSPVRERGSPPVDTRYFAILQTRDAAGQETGPGWVIQVAGDGTVRSIPLGRVDPGQGRALQLWTLWDAARGPVSLGVLPPGGTVRLPSAALPTIGGGQLFEITLEPATGSPTGRPTGRILFIGRAAPAPLHSL